MKRTSMKRQTTYNRFDYVPAARVVNRKHWALTNSTYTICGIHPKDTAIHPVRANSPIEPCGHCVAIIKACKEIELDD